MTDLTNLSHLLSVPCNVIEKNILAITLNASEDEQTQLFVVPPYTFIPDHCHPNVEVEVFPLSGKVEARRSGKKATIQGRGYKKSHIVKAGETHGFFVFDEPFVFISKQKWLHGQKPVSLEKDWSGTPLSRE